MTQPVIFYVNIFYITAFDGMNLLKKTIEFKKEKTFNSENTQFFHALFYRIIGSASAHPDLQRIIVYLAECDDPKPGLHDRLQIVNP